MGRPRQSHCGKRAPNPTQCGGPRRATERAGHLLLHARPSAGRVPLDWWERAPCRLRQRPAPARPGASLASSRCFAGLCFWRPRRLEMWMESAAPGLHSPGPRAGKTEPASPSEMGWASVSRPAAANRGPPHGSPEAGPSARRPKRVRLLPPERSHPAADALCTGSAGKDTAHNSPNGHGSPSRGRAARCQWPPTQAFPVWDGRPGAPSSGYS